MALENGDIIYASDATPFVGVMLGQDRIPQSLSDAVQNAGRACAISPDGSMVAFGHISSGYLDVYLTSTWTRQTVSFTTSQINGLAFSPDGSKLAIAHSTTPFVTIFNTSNWTKIANPATLPTGSGNGVTFSPDGAKLAVAHNTSPFLTVYNVADWSKMADPASIPNVHSLCVDWSPDGTKIAVGLNTSPYIRMVNASDLTPAASAPTFSGAAAISSLAYSPDGSKLAAGVQASAYLRVVNTADWSSISAPAFSGTVNDVAWASNEELVAVSTSFPRMTIWNLTTGATENRSAIAGNGMSVAAMKYTPRTISGVVKDSSGNGISRVVRAYRRDTGENVGQATSNGVTGSYSIKSSYFGECDVVMIDDIAGSIENDQILRTTPV